MPRAGARAIARTACGGGQADGGRASRICEKLTWPQQGTLWVSLCQAAGTGSDTVSMHQPLVESTRSSSIWGVLLTALVAVGGIMCHVGACLHVGNGFPAFIRKRDLKVPSRTRCPAANGPPRPFVHADSARCCFVSNRPATDCYCF